MWYIIHAGGTFTFDGSVEISLAVNQTSRSITFNASNLNISSAVIEQDGQIQECKVQTNDAAETATVTFHRPVQTSSTATLKIKYSGFLNDKLKGFYRSFHNKQVPIAASFSFTTCQIECDS